jgi:hypothetical protein
MRTSIQKGCMSYSAQDGPALRMNVRTIALKFNFEILGVPQVPLHGLALHRFNDHL